MRDENRMFPKKFLEQGLAMAEDSRLFGIAFSDMTREELMAAAAQGWKREQEEREEGRQREMSLLKYMRRSA